MTAYEEWHSGHYPKWLVTDVLDELDAMDRRCHERMSWHSDYFYLAELSARFAPISRT